jgi:hypothetical protein
LRAEGWLLGWHPDQVSRHDRVRSQAAGSSHIEYHSPREDVAPTFRNTRDQRSLGSGPEAVIGPEGNGYALSSRSSCGAEFLVSLDRFASALLLGVSCNVSLVD